MAPRFEKLLKIGEQIGDRRVERVLEAIFLREKNAYRCDKKDYDERVEEVKSRIQHRHGIILELKKFESDSVLDECLEDLKAVEREDLDEIGWLIQRSYAAGLRIGEKSKIIKKLRKFK